MTASWLQSKRAIEREGNPRLSHYTLHSEGTSSGKRGKEGGKDLILENDRSSPPLSLPRCIDLHRGDRQKWTIRRRWPLSGSTKPEILDVLGVAAATRTATCQRLISANKEKKRSRFTFITSLGRILRWGRPTFGHLQLCIPKLLEWRRRPSLSSTITKGFLSRKHT